PSIPPSFTSARSSINSMQLAALTPSRTPPGSGSFISEDSLQSERAAGFRRLHGLKQHQARSLRLGTRQAVHPLDIPSLTLQPKIAHAIEKKGGRAKQAARAPTAVAASTSATPCKDVSDFIRMLVYLSLVTVEDVSGAKVCDDAKLVGADDV